MCVSHLINSITKDTWPTDDPWTAVKGLPHDVVLNHGNKCVTWLLATWPIPRAHSNASPQSCVHLSQMESIPIRWAGKMGASASRSLCVSLHPVFLCHPCTKWTLIVVVALKQGCQTHFSSGATYGRFEPMWRKWLKRLKIRFGWFVCVL